MFARKKKKDRKEYEFLLRRPCRRVKRSERAVHQLEVRQDRTRSSPAPTVDLILARTRPPMDAPPRYVNYLPLSTSKHLAPTSPPRDPGDRYAATPTMARVLHSSSWPSLFPIIGDEAGIAVGRLVPFTCEIHCSSSRVTFDLQSLMLGSLNSVDASRSD